MMSSVIGFFIDNQQRVKYPIDYISSKLGMFDRIVWCCGDDEQVKILGEYRDRCLLKDRIDIRSIGIKITEPRYINIGMNKVFDVLEEYDADFLFLSEADVMLTPTGEQEIKNWMEGNEKYIYFPIRQVKIFCFDFISPNNFYGHRKGSKFNVSEISSWHRECDGEVIDHGKGSKYFYKNDGKTVLKPPFDENPPLIDLGYFSFDIIKEKWTNHHIIWNGGVATTKFQLLLDNKIDEFILQTFKEHNLPVSVDNMIPYSGYYKDVIDELGVYDQWETVKRVIQCDLQR